MNTIEVIEDRRFTANSESAPILPDLPAEVRVIQITLAVKKVPILPTLPNQNSPLGR